MTEFSFKTVANKLAHAHKSEDPQTNAVFVSFDHQLQEIRMVEVSGSVGYTGEILPYRFKARPDLDIPYATSVVLLSEEELTELQGGKLKLPEHWGSIEEFESIDLQKDG